jgi:hypothetical protein
MDIWIQVTEATLQQGDYLAGCLVPVFDERFFASIHAQQSAGAEEGIQKETEAPEEIEAPGEVEMVNVDVYDLIILTQSCDLENDKAKKIVVCACYAVEAFTKKNPDLGSKSKLNEISSGRMWGLFMLPSPTAPSEALVLDFRDLHALPTAYVKQHAASLGPRWRLQSPHTENMSRAFAELFGRVAVPTRRFKF